MLVIIVFNYLFNFIILFVSLILAVIIYCKWAYSYWSRRGVETPKTIIPFGNALQQFLRRKSIGDDLTSVYKECRSKGLKYCGYYLAVRPTWIVLDLALLKHIMTKDFVHFMDHGTYINEKNDPLTGQLFMQKGVKWKNLRVKLTPTFTSGKMKMMFPTLLQCSHELMNVINKAADEQQALEIKDIFARFTTDIIGSCAFGIDCNSLKDPNSKFRLYGKKIFERNGNQFYGILKSLCLAICPTLLDIFKIPIFPRDVSSFFMKIVKDTVEYRETNGIMRKDFMHLLIQLKNNVKVKDEETIESLSERSSLESESGLTLEEITAQAFVFFLAGFETSSTTLTFCLYELSCNKELQERARKEILEIYHKYEDKLTYEALMDMTYMEMCINETLRKYPPLPVLLRQCTKTYKVPESDLIIEKGIRVFLPIYGIQHDPEYYPEPERFDPERFNQANKVNHHSFSWLPFGEGPRICIGQRFGMMEMKVALAILLKNYKFSLNEKTSTPLVFHPRSFIITTKDGIWLNIARI